MKDSGKSSLFSAHLESAFFLPRLSTLYNSVAWLVVLVVRTAF